MSKYGPGSYTPVHCLGGSAPSMPPPPAPPTPVGQKAKTVSQSKATDPTRKVRGRSGTIISSGVNASSDERMRAILGG